MNTSTTTDLDPTTRFTGKGTNYDIYRPDYPAAVIDTVFAGFGPPTALKIADIGAGTGIASRLMLDRGVSLVAVEPNSDMRALALAKGIDVRATRAEVTGLVSGVYDIVSAFTAFHWFASLETLAEFDRLLRPGGRIAIAWNVRDDRDEFTSGYGDVFEKPCQATVPPEFFRSKDSTLGLIEAAGFINARKVTYSWTDPLTLEVLLGRAKSTSYMPAPTDPLYEPLIEAISAWHQQFAGTDGRVDFHFNTELYLAEKRKPN